MYTTQLFESKTLECLRLEIKQKKIERKKFIKSLKVFLKLNHKFSHGISTFQSQLNLLNLSKNKMMTQAEKKQVQMCKNGINKLNTILMDADHRQTIAAFKKEIVNISKEINRLESHFKHVALAKHESSCPGVSWRQSFY